MDGLNVGTEVGLREGLYVGGRREGLDVEGLAVADGRAVDGTAVDGAADGLEGRMVVLGEGTSLGS